MLRQLRIKFICIIMVIVTLMLLVIFGFIYHSTRQDLEEQSMRMLQSVVMEHDGRGRAGQLAPPELPDGPNRPISQPDQVLLPFFTLQEQSDGTLTATGNALYDLTDQDFLAELKAQVEAQGVQTGVLSDYALRFSVRSDPMGSWIAFADLSSERATLTGLLRTFSVIGSLSLAAFLGISVMLSRWAVRPVEQAWNQQRQFVADASHELKTPLTVITTNAELLKAPDSTEAERGRFADSILTMSGQMRGLVEGLLELARADNGTAKMDFAALNFSALVEDALLPFEPVFFEKRLMLDSGIQEGIRVNGSASHLKQVVDILLDNAQKYAGGGANVTVTLKRQDKGHCLLTVANEGAPIEASDLKKIFLRFYRADKARSMNHSYGLGLSIAQSIVEQHRGKIWAESENGVNSFFVRLGTIN